MSEMAQIMLWDYWRHLEIYHCPTAIEDIEQDRSKDLSTDFRLKIKRVLYESTKSLQV